MKKVLILELNEFNNELLKSAAEILKLKNIQKVLALNYTKLTTNDTYDSNYLEPWVQWVSAHTGVPSSTHHVKHLGDVPGLEHQQIWEILSQYNVSSGVWGLMNASRNEADKCQFFFPDPWTFSEKAYPKDLNAFLDLPRYASKNYFNLNKYKLFNMFTNAVKTIFKTRLSSIFFFNLPSLLANIIRFGGQHFVYISFADYISSKVFLKHKEKYNTDFSILFLNSIAHLQHHHWDGHDYKNNKALKYGLKYLDKILNNIFCSLGKDDVFIMMTPLSQVNTNHESPWILYRQLDQANFLHETRIKYERVEPHMSYDAHVFFKTDEDCLNATHILRNARIEGKPLFLVETYDDNRRKIFYRIDYFEQLNSNAVMEINGRKFKFFSLFKAVVRRTGKHIPEGYIYSNLQNLPKVMLNHMFFYHILSLYGISIEHGSCLRRQNEQENFMINSVAAF